MLFISYRGFCKLSDGRFRTSFWDLICTVFFLSQLFMHPFWRVSLLPHSHNPYTFTPSTGHSLLLRIALLMTGWVCRSAGENVVIKKPVTNTLSEKLFVQYLHFILLYYCYMFSVSLFFSLVFCFSLPTIRFRGFSCIYTLHPLHYSNITIPLCLPASYNVMAISEIIFLFFIIKKWNNICTFIGDGGGCIRRL